MNLIEQLEFKHAYYDVVIKHFSQYAMGTRSPDLEIWY